MERFVFADEHNCDRTYVLYADAQATVEALQKKYDDLLGKYRQLMDFYDKHNGTPCEQIRHQQQVEALQREREQWVQAVGLASTCAGDMEIDVTKPIEMMQVVCQRFATLTAALDAERETSIIGKGEPPPQWSPNAQVRSDIS